MRNNIIILIYSSFIYIISLIHILIITGHESLSIFDKKRGQQDINHEDVFKKYRIPEKKKLKLLAVY